ncbi:hypothetical protein DQT32_03225 [Salmonella enterica subsp. enterica serovar Braenderup]|nr:hypothetical protein [Salmonella enterica subsp. enterica serovar Braenderup]
MTTLWTEKYRPSNLDEYVFKNSAFKQKMEEWISTGQIPHIGFFGPAGTGKTSAIKVLINGLVDNGFIDPTDVTTLNMSDEGMDAVRDKIATTAQLSSFGDYRIFVLEEMEQMSLKSQGSLKRIMEDFHENARFILTSNEQHKIIKPIISRVQSIMIEKHDPDEFTTRIIEILINEGVELDTEESLDLVNKYIKCTFPDFRKTLNTLQSSVVNGKLVKLEDSIDSTASYRASIIEAVQAGNIRQMRELIVQNIPEDEIDGFFSFLYRNVDMFTKDEIKEMKIKVKIRDAVVKQANVSDREMNLSALLCEIDLICNDQM